MADEFPPPGRGAPLPEMIGFAIGALSLALIAGALGFQYIGGYPPCEICHWQRWPHIAAAVIGLGGWGVLQAGLVERKWASSIAWAAVLCILITGAIGVYHAGIEWRWWPGPQACTGRGYVFTGTLDLSEKVVMCDRAAWRLMGISMAGYNAILSLGAGALAALALIRHRA
ncbi:MAG TPA: disulfide bond formation protein B [Rhizomicrobium sp.]|nr:disulfide bond formation protein B [Rhizomicrobium sp.]